MQYLKEEVSIPVDPKKIFYEYAALIKFHQLHDQSVPMVHVLDIHRKASIDIISYTHWVHQIIY